MSTVFPSPTATRLSSVLALTALNKKGVMLKLQDSQLSKDLSVKLLVDDNDVSLAAGLLNALKDTMFRKHSKGMDSKLSLSKG